MGSVDMTNSNGGVTHLLMLPDLSIALTGTQESDLTRARNTNTVDHPPQVQ